MVQNPQNNLMIVNPLANPLVGQLIAVIIKRERSINVLSEKNKFIHKFFIKYIFNLFIKIYTLSALTSILFLLLILLDNNDIVFYSLIGFIIILSVAIIKILMYFKRLYDEIQ